MLLLNKEDLFGCGFLIWVWGDWYKTCKELKALRKEYLGRGIVVKVGRKFLEGLWNKGLELEF